MADVEENIKNMLKVSLRKQTHSNINNNNTDDNEKVVGKMLRVKFEFDNQTRALSLPRPVKFEELYQKISSSLNNLNGLVLHYINPNKEIFGQITNQIELEQIVHCVDHNSKYRSLRILVTSNIPQRVASSSASDYSIHKSYHTRPGSPPPGYLHPNDVHVERSTSFPISHVDGEFIPEDDAISTSQSGDSSYSSSRQSLIDTNWGGSGRRQKISNLKSHSELPDESSINQQKIGTFPMRVHPSTYTKPEGRQTLPHIRHAEMFQQMISSSGHNPSNAPNNFYLPPSLMLDKTMTKSKAPSLVDYKKGPLLGRGGFGTVYKCLDSESGREFAMKEVILASPYGYSSDAIKKDAECLENEILIYKELTCHQRIVQYYGAKRDNFAMYIFMEYMSGGSVKDQLRQYGTLPHRVVAKYTKQILQGLAFLHQKLIIHRDIKAANILRDVDGNVKLSDFGASRYLKSISIHNVGHSCSLMNSGNSDATNKHNNNNKGGLVNSFCGTFYFMAPEVIRGESYSNSADIWSLGATVVEMLTGNPPYHDLEPYAALYRIANTSKVEYKPIEPISREMEAFIDQMFISIPQERATAESLLNCAFIQSVSAD